MSVHKRHQHLKHGAWEVHFPDLKARQGQERPPQDDAVATVVQIETVFAPNTFPPGVPVTWIGEPVRVTDPAEASVTAISAPTGTDEIPEPTNTNLVQDDTTPSQQRSSLAPTGAAATSSPTSTAASSSSTEEGMSVGGKAGLAIGILLILGTILAVALFCLKRKKKQKKAQEMQMAARDNEKGSIFHERAPSPMAASTRSVKTMSTAPQVSLRPITQFSPTLEEQRQSSARELDMMSGAPASRPSHLAPSAQPVSAWERLGSEKHGAEDPFSDPVDPFGNHAAAAAPVHRKPVTNAPTGPLPPAPAPVELDSSMVSNDSSTLAASTAPKALSIRSERSNLDGDKPLPSPASMAWTEDIPSSGPATPQPAAGRQADAAASSAATAAAAAGGAVAAMNGPGPGPSNVHRVQMDFMPSMDDEIEIRAGSLVRMLHEYDDGWALCIRLDRSVQGVCPRSCLSKYPVKPRQGPPPQNRRPPPPGARSPMGPNGPAVPRPLTPSGRNSPGPQQRSPPQSAGRARAKSNAHPAPQRSQSPGPYNGQQKPPRVHPDGRRRSNSAGQVMARRMSPPGSSPLGNGPQAAAAPARKPVPGQAL